VSCLRLHIFEAHEFVGSRGRPSELGGPLETEDQDVKDETVVLCDEARELKAPDQSIGVSMTHVLKGDNHIVLSGHVVSEVVIHNKPQKLI